MLFPILAGAGLGTLLIVLARTRRGDELRVLAVGLFVAASLYIGFALRSGDGRWLLIEAGGAALFGAIAWVGLRAAGWVAIGWVAHMAWDVWLHLDRPQPVVGTWYPLSCVGFDLIVAGYVLRAALSPAGPTPDQVLT
jgi:hypothetical protein